MLSMAISATLPASVAQAAENRYGWCEIKGRNGGAYYQSEIMQIPSGSDASYALQKEFTAFARSLDGSMDYSGECWTFYSSVSDAKYHLYLRKESIQNDEHATIQPTGWTGGHDVTDAAPEPTKSGPYLTVKTDTSGIDARKKWEQAVLQSQRDDAAARAKQIADTARDRADMQVKLDKMFEAMRKRGSAQ